MQVLVLLCFALLRSEALKLCDTGGLCSCDRTWGKFNCSCASTQTKVIQLGTRLEEVFAEYPMRNSIICHKKEQIFEKTVSLQT